MNRSFCTSVWSLDKPLVAKMKSSVVDNLPQPVVILKPIVTGKVVDDDKVALSPEEDPKQYGDLLKDFSMVDTYCKTVARASVATSNFEDQKQEQKTNSNLYEKQ